MRTKMILAAILVGLGLFILPTDANAYGVAYVRGGWGGAAVVRPGFGYGYGGVGRRWPAPYLDGSYGDGYESPPRPPAPVLDEGEY